MKNLLLLLPALEPANCNGRRPSVVGHDGPWAAPPERRAEPADPRAGEDDDWLDAVRSW